MNLFADEGVDRPIVERLRLEGYDVVYVAELSPSVTDEEVLQQAVNRGSLLVTADKDFGELVHRLGRFHGGVVLLRLSSLSPSSKANIVAEAFQDHGDEMVGAFSVVSPGLVRIRPSSNP